MGTTDFSGSWSVSAAACSPTRSYQRDEWSPWTVGLAIIAVVFNPLAPIHLTRAIWSVLNVGSAVFLLAHMYSERSRPGA